MTSQSRFDRGAINDFLHSRFSLLRVSSPLRFPSDSAAEQNDIHSRGESTMHKTHRIRTYRCAVRRCLTVAVAGVLALSTLQDASAQMCQGSGGMDGGGGRMGGGQGGGGGAGMMQMMQVAQQAQAMQQQQAMLAVMQRRQQLAAQQQSNRPIAPSQTTRSGRSYSEARRNRFRRARTAARQRTTFASRTQSSSQADQVLDSSETSSSVSLPPLSGQRDTSMRLRVSTSLTERTLPEYVTRLARSHSRQE